MLTNWVPEQMLRRGPNPVSVALPMFNDKLSAVLGNYGFVFQMPSFYLGTCDKLIVAWQVYFSSPVEHGGLVRPSVLTALHHRALS
jgi:hypothetical protein